MLISHEKYENLANLKICNNEHYAANNSSQDGFLSEKESDNFLIKYY